MVGSALERRDTAEFATIHFHALPPRRGRRSRVGRSVGRNTRFSAKTQGQRRPRFGFQRKEAAARPHRPAPPRATHALPVQSPSSCHEITERERGGGHKATHTSRTRPAQSKQDGRTDAADAQTADGLDNGNIARLEGSSLSRQVCVRVASIHGPSVFRPSWQTGPGSTGAARSSLRGPSERAGARRAIRKGRVSREIQSIATLLNLCRSL